jgi:hypothetical protein
MTHWFWIDGRFAWPFVAALVLLAWGLVGADFIWRELTIPFETLAMIFLAAFVFVAGTAVVLAYFLRRAPVRQ